MLVCFAFCRKDKEQAVRLANWIAEMGLTGDHDVSLVRNDTDSAGVIEPLRQAFKTVAEFTPHETGWAWKRREGQARDNNWPQGPNAMWRCTAWEIFNRVKRPWLWMEPDAILTRRTSLDEIESAYRDALAAKKVFLGSRGASVTVECMNGVAVYPPAIFGFMEPMMLAQDAAWDLAGAAPMMAHGIISTLFQHVYKVGEREPRFPDDAAILDPRAAIFHRDSDGTLIEMLRSRLPQKTPPAVDSEFPPFDTCGPVDAAVRPTVSPKYQGHIVKQKKRGKKKRKISPEGRAKLCESLAKGRAVLAATRAKELAGA